MARLHPVITLPVYERLLRRGRLRVHGELVLEAKLDGYLVIVYGNRLYMGSGRRAPSWVYKAMNQAGVDITGMGSRAAFIEIYGKCLTPNGFHKMDKYCYRAALVDAASPYSYTSSIEEIALLSRSLGLSDRIELAERIGAESPHVETIFLDYAPSPQQLREMLTVFSRYEGYVLKLYSEKGHLLPPDYGSKLRGLLEVKVKHYP